MRVSGQLKAWPEVLLEDADRLGVALPRHNEITLALQREGLVVPGHSEVADLVAEVLVGDVQATGLLRADFYSALFEGEEVFLQTSNDLPSQVDYFLKPGGY